MNLPKMIELTIPVGDDPDDVFRASMPIYWPDGRPSLELLEEAIRVLAEQAIGALRDADRLLREDT
jgi:hypothetical protein